MPRASPLGKRVPISEIKRRVKLEEYTIDDELKTADMFRLERLFNKPIQELLSYETRTREEIAHELGIDLSTVSIWRTRLGIRR